MTQYQIVCYNNKNAILYKLFIGGHTYHMKWHRGSKWVELFTYRKNQMHKFVFLVDQLEAIMSLAKFMHNDMFTDEPVDSERTSKWYQPNKGPQNA